MLVSSYKKYYKDSSTNNLEELVHSIKNYDFKNYYQDMKEIFYFYKMTNKKIKSENLETNGSTTGIPKSYLFGPNCWECLHNIEFFLRNKIKKTVCVTNIIFGMYQKPLDFNKRENDKIADLVVLGEWSCESHIEKLIETLKDYYSIHGKFNILAHPNILLCLSTNEVFRNWCALDHKINSIINTDFDLSIKKIKNVYVRNQMIDWKSGGNFYTCEYNNFHFLPIFFIFENEIFNLLNLNKKFKNNKIYNVKNEDLISTGDLDNCACGRNYIKLNFITHFRNKIKFNNRKNNKINNFVSFDDLYDQLEDNYYNLQFYQKEKDEINVLYSSKKNKKNDLEIIIDYLNSKGYNKINLLKDKYFAIGRKRYSNWKSNSIEIKEFYKFNKKYF
jgi:hypothetical protein